MPARPVAPCPFCDSQNVACVEIDIGHWAVTCSACLASGSSMADEDSAIDAWQGDAKKGDLEAKHIGFLQKIVARVI